MNRYTLILVLMITVFLGSMDAPIAQIPGQPANSYVVGINWFCNDGYRKSGNKCVSIFSELGGRPANSTAVGINWFCNDGYRKSGNKCVSIFSD